VPGYGWYYTDMTRRQGFWDVCPWIIADHTSVEAAFGRLFPAAQRPQRALLINPLQILPAAW